MASTWAVVAQTPSQVLSGGDYVDGVDMTIQLGDGSQMVVEVTDADYSDTTTVKGIIQAAVDLHDANGALTGP